ncbi:ATP-binding protein [Sphingobacterium sp. SGL-16]|uniref:hybrid sensor histidine kinase/response regulator n=1 Tax=Sphingobacterium sp. SGL-16 TaxID=2710883 RepID=UPI0013EBC49E|nr:ATP-binding protein [Sphingobacterium sp. SGL-16]NGM72354.1 response regulator [Sphingobacterium sp. SGL-16]
MIEKQIHSRNRIRTALLVATIALFLFITTIFFISINYFEGIQKRISNLIELTNYKDSRYENAVNYFLEAENHFRQFSIDLQINNYKEYEKDLLSLSQITNEIIESHQRDSVQFAYDLNSLVRLDKYKVLQTKIKQLTALSTQTDTLQSRLQNTVLSSPPSTKNLTIDINKVKKSPQNKEKSIIYNIVKIQQDPVIDEEVIHTYNEEIKNFSKSNYSHFFQFRNTYESIRKSERKLLANHFTLLYSIYQTLLEINDLQLLKQKQMLQNEHQDLLRQSGKLTWQTILCLVFIFILIFIMIYYQFRNKYYEEQLIQEQQYAAKLASEKSDILAEISHEIRTPINSLIGIIDLLRRRSNIYSEKEKLFLDSAYSNISNTSRTINDILNLSKMDYTSSIELKDFDIEELAHDIYLIHKSQAEIKNIALEVIIEEDTPTIIHCDELKIRQILTNLISNGIKYTMHGKVSCYIMINELNNLYIRISDTGLGISESMQPNIFKKYFTKSDENKLSNGIGLGLYITKRLVKQLQGSITFTSKENYGSTFTIEIPIPKAKKKNKPSVTYNTLADLPGTISWLLVDDNILNILYLKQYFQSFTQVKTASNGLEALEILKNYTPDIIITDINMPIMTGDELLVYIRKLPELAKTKVIATSSDYEQIKELEKKRMLTFDNIIIKPFNEKDLVKIIIQTSAIDSSSE